MANVVFKAVAEAGEGLATKVVSRDFEITLDEPAELGGTDTGMNPVEALLASLAACKSIVVRAFVRKYRIKLKSIRVEVEGDLDPDGFLGKNPEAKIGFSEIRSHFFIEADNTDEEIERYIDFVERNCPVQDTLTKAARISHTIN
ncbi:MAG TPA: OsmC family protein [Bacillota bacterium]|nr:OsmC family protein [Fastidiosipila sp.]HPX92842.1 OsmC family protein [Bacillota bacterium]HQB81327.1 OsmC family protein [Bacillota bacterium]